MPDILLVTDPRFTGGTFAAVETDLRALTAAGFSVGLHFIRGTGFFPPDHRDNAAFLALRDLPGVEVPTPGQRLHCRFAFFHNPQAFQTTVEPALAVACTRSVVVAHHPPFLGDGALCYDPLQVTRSVARQFGTRPAWAPVSGLVRGQLASFRPFLELTARDWPNRFEMDRWPLPGSRLSGPILTIGRHSRPDPSKWPDTAAGVSASLPASGTTRVRIMGADKDFFEARGVPTEGWELLPFNALPVQEFLSGLDLFGYHHSTGWVEAFGRSVAEAMLSGLPCLLDPALRPTFGAHALYPRPGEVAGVIAAIRHDPAPHLHRAEAALLWCRNSLDATGIATAVEALDRHDLASVRTVRAVRPLTTLRKVVGFHRRNRMRQAAPAGAQA